MLPTALDEPDPVVIFEHNALYGLKGELSPDAGPVSLDRAAIRRSGDDITIVAWAGMVGKSLDAADRLAESGVGATVVDLRSLRPLDLDTLAAAADRTHHVLVVDEGWRTGGLGAEVAAAITERSFWQLDAPVRRLATAEVPIPYAQHLEQAAIPQTDDIVAAATELVETGR